MRSYWGLGLLLLGACATSTPQRHVAGGERIPDPPTYAAIESFVKKHQIATADDFVARLPEEYLSNYTLAYHSRSAQGASATHPRVLSFGRNAQVVIAFNGHPSQRGFRQIEIMEFPPLDKATTEEVKLRSIVFPASEKFADVQFRDTKEKNKNCLTCHFANPKPHWDEYSTWAGFFGSNDDKITEEERKAFAAFSQNFANMPIYRHLTPPPGSDETSYSTRDKGPLLHRPNARLNIFLNQRNTFRILGILKKSKLYPRLSRKFLQTSIGCERDRSDPSEEEVGKICAKMGLTFNDHTLSFGKLDSNVVPKLHGSSYDGITDIESRLVAAIVQDLAQENAAYAKFFDFEHKDLPDERRPVVELGHELVPLDGSEEGVQAFCAFLKADLASLKKVP